MRGIHLYFVIGRHFYGSLINAMHHFVTVLSIPRMRKKNQVKQDDTGMKTRKQDIYHYLEIYSNLIPVTTDYVKLQSSTPLCPTIQHAFGSSNSLNLTETLKI